MINFIKKNLEKIKDLIFLEETLDLFKRMYNILKNKYEIILWIIFLPFTFIFLIENLIVYLISFFFYIVLFFYKKKKRKKIKKNLKITYKKRFLFLENIFFVVFKNILFEYPKCRAFLSFYYTFKKIKEFKNSKNKEKIDFLKILIKTIFNRYLILFLFGLPYLLLYCNCRLTKRFYEILLLKKKQNSSLNGFLVTFLVNLNRDISPFFIFFIKKFKIIFLKRRIIFNPGKNNINKKIIETISKHKLEKQIKILVENSIIDFGKNKKEDVKNEKGEIIKTFWSESHIETYLEINKNGNEIISINETSKPHIKTNNNEKIENIVYGNCSYKKGVCYITKPILTKMNYKNYWKDSINYKIKNIDLDKVNYNQILAILFNLKKGFIEAIYIEEEKKIVYFYKENKNDLINIIRKSKNNMKQETYESIENSNKFFEEIEEINQNLNLNEKIILLNYNINYNLINNNNSLYEMLKLK